MRVAPKVLAAVAAESEIRTGVEESIVVRAEVAVVVMVMVMVLVGVLAMAAVSVAEAAVAGVGFGEAGIPASVQLSGLLPDSVAGPVQWIRLRHFHSSRAVSAPSAPASVPSCSFSSPLSPISPSHLRAR